MVKKFLVLAILVVCLYASAASAETIHFKDITDPLGQQSHTYAFSDSSAGIVFLSEGSSGWYISEQGLSIDLVSHASGYVQFFSDISNTVHGLKAIKSITFIADGMFYDVMGSDDSQLYPEFLIPEGTGVFTVDFSQYDYDTLNLFGVINLASRPSTLTLISMEYGSANPAPTPEPGTIVLMGAGLLGMLGMRRRFKK